MAGFTFRYPIFKGLEIKRTEASNESTCNIFLNEPTTHTHKTLPHRIIIPPIPAPRIQVAKESLDIPLKTDTKNVQNVFYKLFRSAEKPFHEYILFLGKGFVIDISLFGIDEKFPFSKDIFWKSIIDSFSFR